jgi:hypothetical protein
VGSIIFENVKIFDGSQMHPRIGAVRVEGKRIAEVSDGAGRIALQTASACAPS